MRRKTLTKPKNEIWLKGVCVNKSVNKKGMFPNPMLHKLYPRIFTQEGYIVTSTFFLDREVWLTKDLTKEEKWVYWLMKMATHYDRYIYLYNMHIDVR